MILEKKFITEEAKTSSSSEYGPVFEKYVAMGIKMAIAKIKSNFEGKNPDKENPERDLENLPFHESGHTNTVIRRLSMILEIMKKHGFASSRDVILGPLAGAYHDQIQNWKKTEEKNNTGETVGIKRERDLGGNEEASAQEALNYMESVNKKEGKEVFTEKDKIDAHEAILATVPSKDLHPEHPTIFQPNFKKENPAPIEAALALADLGGAGMDGPEQYFMEGDTFFREEKLDIYSAMKNPAMLTDKQKESFKKRMIGWSNFQPKFAAGRKALFESEIVGLPPAVQADLKTTIFNKFDASVEAAKQRAKKRESMTFEELARDFGYTI